jgi:hypothetical protein
MVKAPSRTLLFISMVCLFSFCSVPGEGQWSILRCGRLLTYSCAYLSESNRDTRIRMNLFRREFIKQGVIFFDGLDGFFDFTPRRQNSSVIL